MHEYTCKECDSKKFYTDFEPKFEPPAFCPCCGQDETVSYVGIKKAETDNVDQIDLIIENMRTLHDIQKGSVKYGLSDLSDWLANDLEKVCVLLDQLRNDLDGE